MSTFYAHSREGEPDSSWEDLETHLREVAECAQGFTSLFDSAQWGTVAGLWHDLGKFHPRFQQRLRDSSIRQSHSGAGAVLAFEKDRYVGKLLAAVIAGHHSGLPNMIHEGELDTRLANANRNEWVETKSAAARWLMETPLPALPAWIKTRCDCDLWLRFVFSALVDADRLCTEKFYEPDQSEKRAGNRTPIPELVDLLENAYLKIRNALLPAAAANHVNTARLEISEACLTSARLPPGLFSLTVPTGGGKTLAAMRFALHHANTFGKQRVIVVIPYTSIIEQNARNYADIFGAENVLEHHSNLDVERRREAYGETVTDWQDLAAENWDASIIVTTTVQFFESLFTNHPSRARKLHNIANCVLILDEIQSLPPEYLHTILDGLKLLAKHFGCTILLSTATPPALKRHTGMDFGLEGVREIIANPSELALRLTRVHYEWPEPDAPPIEWPALADEVKNHERVLIVTHRRADARDLAGRLMERVAPDSVLHLSALMCPRHRLEVLNEVRERLKNDMPCRLVSTQLIEAGVDVDFPVVYRAMGGLDSMVQAAGRCNREGRHERGLVKIFKSPSKPPAGVPLKGLEAVCLMLKAGELSDAANPETQERFFRRLYNVSTLDTKNIQTERNQLNFRNVAKKFRLIEDGFTHPVIVPWGDADQLVNELRRALEYGTGTKPLRERFRELQPYTVSVHANSFEQALASGALQEICEGLHCLGSLFARHYDPKFGLIIGDDIGVMAASSTII